MANNITTTHVYKVNGRLVIAKDAVEAINILTEYLKDTNGEYCVEDVTSLEMITDGYTCSSNDAIVKNPKIDISVADIRNWYINNISNPQSVVEISEKLHKFITEWKQYK